ncbi:MAG: macro domain-containing protein, partial [Bacillus sp. (in: firmicutes)]
MTRLEKIKQLNQYLLEDEPEYTADAKHFPNEESKQRLLLRSLMNVWLPKKELNPSYLKLQDELLQEELNEKGIVDLDSLLPSKKDSRFFVWKGDITRLRADAIVNAANSQMLGCFIPCHSCIDNAIHSAAGLQLREECSKIMNAQGYEEPTGSA